MLVPYISMHGSTREMVQYLVAALTERGLAGLIGVSQPHMHNILKGIRKLSPVVADRILATLEISLLDLVAQGQTPLEGLPPMAAPKARSRGGRDDSKR